MTAHDVRLWDKMAGTAQAYLIGECGLGALVSELNACLQASEITDRTIVEEFYRYWEPLENEYACSREMGLAIDEKRMRSGVEEMLVFLNRTRARVQAYDP